jgi:hypothetical protein
MTMFKLMAVPTLEQLRERNRLMEAEDRKVFDSMDRILNPCPRCGLQISLEEPVDHDNWAHRTTEGCDRDIARAVLEL